MLSTLVSYKLIARDLPKSLARTASEPQIAREIKYYQENIEKVKSADDLLKDQRLFSFAMKAHGLEDMIYAKAFMRKVLTEGIDDDKAFAKRLQDQRYTDFATTFNFKKDGELTTSLDAAKQATIDRYTRQSLENSAGEENQGLRLALYFERKADSIKGPFDILADPALSQVVRTALGLPESMATSSIDAQAALIRKRLDLTKLKDPTELQRFLQRFTTMWDGLNSAASTSPALTVLTGPSAGIDMDLLLSLQQIRASRY